MTDVKSIQSLQACILDSIWAELAARGYDHSHKTIVTLNANYDATVTALQALLGAEAQCAQIDAALYSTYSDLYKDRAGFRPRGHVTYLQVKQYVDSCKDSDLDHDEDLSDDELLEEAESLTEAQDGRQRSDDHDLLDWQQQAGRFSNVSERHILEY